MAKKIRAVAEYRPKIDLGKMITTNELAKYISRGTALNLGEIENVLMELNEAVIFFGRQGVPLKIDGLGVFRPSIRIDGKLMVNLRLDRSIYKSMNIAGAFVGKVVNSENIGMTQDDMVARWNAEHPEDPVEA